MKNNNQSYSDSAYDSRTGGVDAFFEGIDKTLAQVDEALRIAGINVDLSAARTGVRNAGESVSRSVNEAKNNPVPAGQSFAQLLTEVIRRFLVFLFGNKKDRPAPQPNVADEDLPFVEDTPAATSNELQIPPSGDETVDAVIVFQQSQIAEVENCATFVMRDSLNVAIQLENICRVHRCLLYALAKRPEFLPKLQRFFGYYVPTLLKFCNAYCDLLQQNRTSASVSAQNTMAELETAFASLEQAFRKKADELYGAVHLDISSDISVLDAILRRDGLV